MMVAGWERGRGAEEIHTSAWGWAILRARVVTEREGTCCGRGAGGLERARGRLSVNKESNDHIGLP